MPTRIEINVQTGERKVIELTPEEIADAEARTAAENNDPERLRKLGLDAAITADTQIAALKAITNADFDAWFDANVMTAAQAIGLLRRVCRVLIRRVL